MINSFLKRSYLHYFAILSISFIFAFLYIPVIIKKIDILLNSGILYIFLYLYLSLFISFVFCYFIALYLNNIILRFVFTILFTLFVFIDYFVYIFMGNFLDINLAQTIIMNWSVDFDSSTYFIFFSNRMPFLFLLICGLLIKFPGKLKISSIWSIFIVLVFSFGLYTFVKTDGAFSEFPSYFTVPVNSYYALQKNQAPLKLKEIEIERNSRQIHDVKNVLLVVDESVRYLESINITGQSAYSIDLGQSHSGANCSVSSRWLMRSGTRAGEIVDFIQPGIEKNSILQFAKKAGYYVTIIDAWSFVDDYNGIGEWPFVDNYIHLSNIKKHLRDAEIYKLIEKIKINGQKNFIYIAKYGVHFPYDVSYTENIDDRNLPMIWRTLTSFANPTSLSGTSSIDRQRWLEHYRNGLEWSVNRPMKQILRVLESDENRDFFLIYTSDHGQSLWEDGSTATHCGRNVHPGELQVPMVVATTNRVLRERIRTNLATNFGRTDHFLIMPTLLEVMNFDAAQIKDKYGSTLFEPLPAVRKKMFAVGGIGKNGKFSYAAEWRSISP